MWQGPILSSHVCTTHIPMPLLLIVLNKATYVIYASTLNSGTIISMGESCSVPKHRCHPKSQFDEYVIVLASRRNHWCCVLYITLCTLCGDIFISCIKVHQIYIQSCCLVDGIEYATLNFWILLLNFANISCCAWQPWMKIWATPSVNGQWNFARDCVSRKW